MVKTKPGLLLSDMELSYIAGLFDGEGCISICKSKARNHYTLRAQVSMANEFIPTWLHSCFEGSVSLRPRIGENWKDMWAWIVCAKKAVVFIKAVIPYLILKKPQAEIALQFQESISEWGRNQFTLRNKLTEEELSVRESYYLSMRALNKRGIR